MQTQLTISRLELDDLDHVGGGGASTEWAVATGTAVALTVGATVTAPFVAMALASGGIVAAGMAIYYAVSDEESKTAS